MRWLPKSKKGRSKDPNRKTSATFCVRELASSCAPMWPMTLTILGRSIVHIILGFLIQDAPYVQPHWAPFPWPQTSWIFAIQVPDDHDNDVFFMHSDRFEELLYVCYAAPHTNASFWVAGGINRSFYKKSAGGLFNSGARVSLDFFRMGTLHRSLNPSHLRVTISEIFDTPVQRASASLELLIKINNPLQRGNWMR